MTIRHERVVLDSNVWIFGLRRHPGCPACVSILERLSQGVQVILPRQVLSELQANLTKGEMGELFHFVNQLPVPVEVLWEKAPLNLVRRYRKLGCRLGDAAVAAHLEELGVTVLVTENRSFLENVEGLPFRIVNASEALEEMD